MRPFMRPQRPFLQFLLHKFNFSFNVAFRLILGLIMKSFKEIEKQRRLSLIRLIEFAGSQSRLARALNVSPQVVRGWVKRGRISATYAKVAEKETNGFLTKEELRPDVTVWSGQDE